MAKDLTWHSGTVPPEAREDLLGQKGCVLWFTGLSGSGKSTVARAVEARITEREHICYVLDGDNVRHGLNRDLGFSPADREENIRRIGEVATLFCDAGLITLVSFISPYRKDRDQARSRVPAGRFIEVHIDAPLAVCEERDPKGLYKRARAGEISDFTGIDAPYEAPENPEITVNTADDDINTCAMKVVGYLIGNGFIVK